MFNIIAYFIKELINNLRRFPLMSFTAITTTFISLLVLGVFIVLLINLNSFSQKLTSQFEITVFLHKSLTESEIDHLKDMILSLQQIKEIEYISPEMALKKLEKDMHTSLGIVNDENPLPPAFIIHVKNIKYINELSNIIKNLYGVESVRSGESLLRKVLKISIAIKITGFILFMIMSAASLLTIINTIRLTVISRRKEIRIMQLVGASEWFIRWPFIFEGIFHGLSGAIMAVLTISFGYTIFYFIMKSYLIFLFPIIKGSNIFKVLSLLLPIFGIVMGFLGSYISVGTYLESEI